jgi:hypothetical protein
MLTRQKINQVQEFLDESKCTPGEVVMILREQARVQRNKIHSQLEKALKKLEQAGFISKGWNIEEECGEGWLRMDLLKPVVEQLGNTVMYVQLLENPPQFDVKFKGSTQKHTFEDLQNQYPIFKPLCLAMREWIQFTHSTVVQYPSRGGVTVIPLLSLMSQGNYSFPMNQ